MPSRPVRNNRLSIELLTASDRDALGRMLNALITEGVHRTADRHVLRTDLPKCPCLAAGDLPLPAERAAVGARRNVDYKF
jgi:hypothetical protein